MAPGLKECDSNAIIAVKRISENELVECVCHVGEGSPPKPVPYRQRIHQKIHQITPIEKQAANRKRKTVHMQLPTDIREFRIDEANEAAEIDSDKEGTERQSPKEEKTNEKKPSEPSQMPRRKASQSQLSPCVDENKSYHLLTLQKTRRHTVGNCVVENNPLFIARCKALNEKLDAKNSTISNNSQSSQESLDELSQPPYDPVKVTNLDIDAGSYAPNSERMDFLKRALSVSSVPFPPEERKTKSTECLEMK